MPAWGIQDYKERSLKGLPPDFPIEDILNDL